MTEFGHEWAVGPGFRMDNWGVGPFELTIGKIKYRFEDSDRFGPSMLKRDGELRDKPWFNEGHPFWDHHHWWVSQGRKTEEDGVTCVYVAPETD